MAITESYDKELNILTLKIVGYLKLNEYEDALIQLINSRKFPENANTLWDLRDMEFDNIDLAFQQKVIQLHKQLNNPRKLANIAIISDYELGSPIIKLFILQATNIYNSMHVFKTVDEGIAWLLKQKN